MPHIIIEHGGLTPKQLGIENLFKTIAATYEHCDIIAAQNVKMRAMGFNHIRVGGEKAPFIHITVAMMRGPEPAAQQALVDQMHDAVCEQWPQIHNITLELREMDPATYRKRRKTS